MPGQVFDPRQTVGNAVAKATYDVAVETAIKLAQSYVWVLTVPFVKQCFEFLTRKFMGLLYRAIEDGAVDLIIDIKVDRELKEYKDSVKQFEQALQSGNEDKIEKEREKFKERLRDLISMRP